MKMTASDLATAYVDWVKSEIKEGPKQGYDLGKFFFGVSVGTIGALATIEKINEKAALDSLLLVSFGALFVSILVALDLARPRLLRLGGDTDLQDEYARQLDAINLRVWVWLAVWLVGTLVGAYAVRQ